MKRFPYWSGKSAIAALALLLLCLTGSLAVSQRFAAARQTPGPVGKSGRVLLHNGWTITPAGDRHEETGDMLLGAAMSPDGKWLAVVNGGAAAHRLSVVDTQTGKIVSSAPLERSQSTDGVAFSSAGDKLFVSGGNAGKIYAFQLGDRAALTPMEPFAVPGLRPLRGALPDPATDAGHDPVRQIAPEEDSYLGGLALLPASDTVYVSNVAGDSIYALDFAKRSLKVRRKLNPYDRPGAVAVSKDGGTVYVALLGSGVVLALDSATLETKSTIRVGAHPNALCLAKDGSRLFVSCGNDDTVCAIDTATGIVREKINMRLSPRSPAGATPSALALSPDDSTLYVVNSDNNDVCVVDVRMPGSARIEGFIPTAWYPTLVCAGNDGKHLFIGCGKGMGTGPNDRKRPISQVAPAGSPYIVALLKGDLAMVDVPDTAALALYTAQVRANTRFRDSQLDHPAQAPAQSATAIPVRPGEASPIKYVLYIIKENRTYDQVLGDLRDASGKKLGNGDPELCLFGEKVTPNHHALAREFVTLDNLYADGEVSVDGHHWSNAAYVPDVMQRTWPSEYGGKGGTPIRYGDFGDPLAETPGGRIWDLCDRAGVTYRTYYYHVHKRMSDEWGKARSNRVRDYAASDIFVRDLQGWSKAGEMPRFVVMALSEDHTKGTRPGSYTPQACVASNDLAVGKIVEACSKSPFWSKMAVFIVEDDAQNGADHVDAHRTVALVASPYARRHSVDSTMYSTCSLLRTMELILRLPPMSQFDASANVMFPSFSAQPDMTPYQCRPAGIDLDAKNTRLSYGAGASLRLSLSEPDQLTERDEDTLNRILWHSIRGAKSPYPTNISHRSIKARD